MKVSDSSIILESPKQQINKWMEPGPGHRKNILGCELVAEWWPAPHTLPLSLSPQHALIHYSSSPPPPRSQAMAVVALLGLTTTTTTPSSRIGQVSLHQPAQGVQRPPFSCIPSQPSHFKDELIIHHTRTILSVEKQ